MKAEQKVTLYDRAQRAAEQIRSRAGARPSVAVVLGSGLGGFAEELSDSSSIPYKEIQGFAQATVEGHAGQLVIGRAGTVAVAAMQGRFHFYEGYSLDDVTFPVRVLKLLGVQTLILTNAAGSLNTEFTPGSLMVISDHINLMGVNPLRGPEFIDMSEAYSREYREIAKKVGILKEGVYAGLLGPSYETPAEIRYLRTIGADLVGMSTVPEVIAANHMGIKVLGISCVTNMAAGILPQKLTHSEVLATGDRVKDTLAALLRAVIPKLK